ncbi:MAG: M23 family metallopeptidase [Thermodesulfovibrionales bacterium]
MFRIRRFVRRLFTPVTILMIPHDSNRTVNIRLPSIGIVLSVLVWLAGSVYIISAAVETREYHRMKSRLGYYAFQFAQLKSTMTTLKKAEEEFQRLLSFKSRHEILENVDKGMVLADAGSVDMEVLKEQIRKRVESVSAIKDFLREQRDVYMATPRGWPLAGRVTSEFGFRENPSRGGREFHSGLDISTAAGTPVRATAEGVVSFAGWSAGNGNLVVIEHGFGFSTFYAHNSSTVAGVGKRVKRGDIVAYSGSTGNSTGPHLHYEVWHEGKAVDPRGSIREAEYVSGEK